MAIDESYKKNYDTLINSVTSDRSAMMECKRKSDGEIVNLVCALNYDRDTNEIIFIPIAEMIAGNPFDMYCPPDKNGGFCTD